MDVGGLKKYESQGEEERECHHCYTNAGGLKKYGSEGEERESVSPLLLKREFLGLCELQRRCCGYGQMCKDELTTF